MAVTILANRKNTSATLHVASANATIIVAGNTSVSNVAMSGELLTGASITQIAWGCDGVGYIQIFRGANLVAVYDSTSYIDYAGNGISLTKDSHANVVVNFIGSANQYCIFELQKIGTFASTDYNIS